jgi:hypothetical protein
MHRRGRPGAAGGISGVPGLGIGTRLAAGGLDHLRKAATFFVVVLGHPEYYSRFDFLPASRFQIACPFADVPDEAFMILILNEATLRGVTGMARYRPEFSAVVWRIRSGSDRGFRSPHESRGVQLGTDFTRLFER